tara:strand:+ start:62 stop:442 length:381 start_codon:yes stop_codon:yes gene_type:complete
MSNEVHHFSWNELMSKNVKKDRAFYKAVFNWDSEDRQFGETMYTLFKANGVEVAGMMAAPDECPNPNSSWLSYVTVSDVDATVKKATEAGADIVLPRMDIEGVGIIAAAVDVSGAPIGFYQPTGKC